MELVEPKVGDRIFHSGRITTIDGFDEDSGTRLHNGQWVCISEFEKDKGGVWIKKIPPRTYGIGESYRNSSLRKGIAVIRPAVFQGGQVDRVVTTSPCCVLFSRLLSFDDLNSELAAKQGGWSETCTQCKAHYALTLAYNGSPRLGLYGVRWESLGF